MRENMEALQQNNNFIMVDSSEFKLQTSFPGG